MKVTTYETLYHEDHGAILKHKCGKIDSSIVPSLFFSHSFFSFSFLLFFFGLLFFLFFLFGLYLYHEDHGATLKHKCGKRIVTLSLLSFSLIFCFFIWAFSPFVWPLFFLFFYLGFFGLFYLFIYFRPESHPDLWGIHSLHHPFLTGTMI